MYGLYCIEEGSLFAFFSRVFYHKCMLYHQSLFLYLVRWSYFKLGYGCFPMLYWFLLYNRMNQPFIYTFVYPLSLGPPSNLTPSHLSRSAQSTALSPLCYSSFPPAICFTHGRVCQSQSSSSSYLNCFVSTCHCVGLHLHSCLENRFICTVF